MERKKVWAVYFSATDTTKKTVLTIADEAARLLGAEREDYDFTLPGMRENGFAAGKDDLVIFGTPVYAGRVPNVLPFRETALLRFRWCFLEIEISTTVSLSCGTSWKIPVSIQWLPLPL